MSYRLSLSVLSIPDLSRCLHSGGRERKRVSNWPLEAHSQIYSNVKLACTQETDIRWFNCTCGDGFWEVEWLLNHLHNSSVVTIRKRATHHGKQNAAPAEKVHHTVKYNYTNRPNMFNLH